MPLPTGLWLWCDGKTIQWWSVYSHGYMDIINSPLNSSGSLANILSTSAEEAFIKSLEEIGYPSSIYLLNSLPKAWINYAWEERRLKNGNNIGDVAPVVRHVYSDSIEPRKIDKKMPIIIFRMYFEDNFKPKWNGEFVSQVCNEQDLHNRLNEYTDAPMLIFAHGNDGNDRSSKPLKDKNGKPWAWPKNITPPAIVIILACDHGGHLRSFARWLLGHGAKSVVIASDLLNAEDTWLAMEVLSRERLKGSFTLSHWVSSQKSLELWGSDAYVSTPTLEHYEKKSAWLLLKSMIASETSISRSPNHLSCDSWGLNKEDTSQSLACLCSMEKLLPQWRTQGWHEVIRGLLPLALDLSERHRHDLMDFFLGFCAEEESVELAAYAAKIHYRQGDYCRSLYCIEKSLGGRKIPIASMVTLLNILIDLNFTPLGKTLLTNIDLKLESLPQKDIHGRKFKLIDQRARLSMRSGNIDSAIRYMKKKKHEQTLGNNSVNRESSWLLFLYAWANPCSDDAYKLAHEAKEILSQSNKIADGNDDYKYMARAFACWVWRVDDWDAAHIIQEFWQISCDKNYGDDPGPLGQTIAYIALLEKQHNKDGWAHKDWPCARKFMQDNGYFFETATLDYLLGEDGKSQQASKTFHDLQNRAINMLSTKSFLPVWNKEGMNIAIEHRKNMNPQPFNHAEHSNKIEGLIAKGMLPL